MARAKERERLNKELEELNGEKSSLTKARRNGKKNESNYVKRQNKKNKKYRGKSL